MKKSGKGGPGRLGGDSWLITFNDLMTLVLTFFVLLLAFSILVVRYSSSKYPSVKEKTD